MKCDRFVGSKIDESNSFIRVKSVDMTFERHKTSSKKFRRYRRIDIITANDLENIDSMKLMPLSSVEIINVSKIPEDCNIDAIPYQVQVIIIPV